MNKLLIFSSILSVFMISCDNKNIESAENDREESEQTHITLGEEIELDNGAKWKVDANMIVHLRKMESDLDNFSGKDFLEFQSLSETLTNDIDVLTSNCTMTGQGHDELHKWLIPYIELVAAFSKSATLEEAESRYQETKSTFKIFNSYFE